MAAFTVPKFKTDITVLLLKSGNDDDIINPGKSEINGSLTTTIIGSPSQTIKINTIVPDGLTFPNNGITLATFSATTFFLPVVFSVFVEENDANQNNPNEVILKKDFDFETTDINVTNLFLCPMPRTPYFTGREDTQSPSSLLALSSSKRYVANSL